MTMMEKSPLVDILHSRGLSLEQASRMSGVSFQTLAAMYSGRGNAGKTLAILAKKIGKGLDLTDEEVQSITHLIPWETTGKHLDSEILRNLNEDGCMEKKKKAPTQVMQKVERANAGMSPQQMACAKAAKLGELLESGMDLMEAMANAGYDCKNVQSARTRLSQIRGMLVRRGMVVPPALQKTKSTRDTTGALNAKKR